MSNQGSERLRNLPKFTELVNKSGNLNSGLTWKVHFSLFHAIYQEEEGSAGKENSMSNSSEAWKVMAHSQNNADLSIAESAVNFKGHVPEFRPYSVTTNSH